MEGHGEILRNYLKINNISTSKLAEKINVTRSTAHSYFSSKKLSAGVIEKITSAYPDITFYPDDEKTELLILKEQIVEYQKRESWLKSIIDKLTPKK